MDDKLKSENIYDKISAGRTNPLPSNALKGKLVAKPKDKNKKK